MATDHKQQALLPCPFCGQSNMDQWPCEWIDGSGANVIRCALCHGAAPLNTWNLRAALSQSAQQAGAVPEGWVLVPLEMTDEMAVAFIEGSPSVRKAWQDAIAAAPPAPSDGRRA